MDIYDMVFLLQFLIIVGLFLASVFNLMKVTKLYSRAAAFLMLIAFFIFYGSGFIVVMLDYSSSVFSVLFQFETLLVLIYVALFLAQLFFYMGLSVGEYKPAYNSREARRLGR